MTGRNEACPCGSGNKYKRCCAEADARRPAPPRPLRAPPGSIKSPADIDGMRRAGHLAARVLDEACRAVRPGIMTEDIDRLVHAMTLDAGAYPAPLNYPHPNTDPRNPVIKHKGFPKSVCTSVNDVVCHGIPDQTVLVDGDIVNVDVTCILDGYFGDTSRTVFVGTPSDRARLVTETARESLASAILAVRHGALFYDIGAAIEDVARPRGLSVVEDFTGHGIGRRFHEPPLILHYRSPASRVPMMAGMTFTIEPMINTGTADVIVSTKDHWTARTADGGLSAQFEHTLVVTETGCEILTQLPS